MTKSNLLSFDPRIRLLIAALLSFSAFFMNKAETTNAIVLLAAVLLLTAGLWKSCAGYAAVYILISVAMTGIETISNTTVMLMLISISYFIQKLMVMLMMGSYLFGTTSVTEALNAMETMKSPKTLTIPFAVAFRFIPSIREDYKALQDSLKIRKIDTSIKGFLMHPILTFEYMVVPILLRSLKTSEELAASAIVRGLDNGKKKTILYPLKLQVKDYLAVIITVAAVGILFWVQFK